MAHTAATPVQEQDGNAHKIRRSTFRTQVLVIALCQSRAPLFCISELYSDVRNQRLLFVNLVFIAKGLLGVRQQAYGIHYSGT